MNIKKKIEDACDKYYICSFDRYGNEVEEYDVDIDEFLYLELTASYDSVDRLECIEDNLFVLQTLNSRIIMFEKIGDELIRVEIPENLHAYYDYYYVPEETSEGSEEPEEEAGKSIFEWVIVEQIETMSLESLAECDPKQELFVILKERLDVEGTYEDYVQMLLDNGCVAVCVRYVNKYTKEVADGLPQIADGEHEQHWLFVPDENGQLRVFDYTHIFAQFSFHPDAEAPKELRWCMGEVE